MQAKRVAPSGAKRGFRIVASTIMVGCAATFICYWGQSPHVTYAAPEPETVKTAAVTPVMPAVKEAPALTPVRVVCSSQELDLTIEVHNEQDQPITGCSFAFTITPAEGDAVQAATDARTGKITVSPLTEGDYTVTMRQTDGYTVAEPVSTAVAPKVVYEVVDVSEKVVTASEVNAAQEDGQFGRPGGAGDAASAPEESIQETPGPEVTIPEETPTAPEPATPPAETTTPAEPTTPGTADTGNAGSGSTDTGNTGSGNTGTTTPTPPDPVIPTPVYRGWQTVDGATYYYDANGEKVTGLRSIDGIAYHFAPDGKLDGKVGIDVSTYQKTVDWQQVKDAGIQFVIIRLGYRGYGSGTLYLDNMYESHIRGAEAVGLKVGVYFFTQAITKQEAVEEASMCVQYVKGHNITYPIAIDMEWVASDARANVMDNDQRTQVCEAFCQTIRSAGYTPAIYANKYYLNNMINTSQLSSYMFWLAHYTEDTDYTGPYGMWQYTSSGYINGIPGRVDLNISYIG